MHHPPLHPAPEALRHPRARLRLLLPPESEAQAAAVRAAAVPVGAVPAVPVVAARVALAQAAVRVVKAQVRRPLALTVQQQARAPLPTYLGPQTNYGCTSHISRCVPRPQEGPRSA